MELQGMENNGFIKEDRIPSSGREPSDKYPAPAVIVRGAYKSFSGNKVLKNLNMTVDESSIYTLIGSSGSGKTTLLSAIVGIKNLDAGEIRVFGETPGTAESGIPGYCCGHMPQEYALYSEFTIQESLTYYGTIYGMEKDKIKERSDFLLNFLNLPNSSRRIATLSGGQRRRCSLAIALIHEPRLLILDEPTVGVDHVLRFKIWNLLRDIVTKSKSTIIITTHYIEEARNSDKLGILSSSGSSKGRLLTEKNPSDLLNEHQVTLLEDAIINLSQSDIKKVSEDETELSVISKVDNSVPIDAYKRHHNNTSKQFPKTPKLSFSRFRALVNKNISLLLRNLLFLLFNFISPALQMIIVCLTVGSEPHSLGLGIVNHENPHSCHTALETFDNSTVTSDCPPANWSCVFLDALPKTGIINLIPYDRDEDALEDVKRGSLWGYLSFPKNFSESLQERMFGGLNPSPESVIGSAISIQLDLSSQTIGSSLQTTLLRSYQKFSQVLLTKCDFDTEAGELPLKFKEAVYGSIETDFREFIAPSILLGLLFFFPLCSAGISFISDRKSGCLDRSYIAGVTNLEVMLSNLFTQSWILFVQAGLSFLILTTIFHINITGSVFLALSLAILVGIAGMSMGFLIATFVKEEIHAVLLAIGSFFPNFLLAGMVWPFESIPVYLQYFSYALPCTLACESMRSIISRGWNLTHSGVWSGFLSTLGWICIYWSLTIFIHRMNKKRN